VGEPLLGGGGWRRRKRTPFCRRVKYEIVEVGVSVCGRGRINRTDKQILSHQHVENCIIDHGGNALFL
jgi:hypothetical protein